MPIFETVLAALGVASIEELLVDFLVAAAILALPFLLGVIYGDVAAHMEREQEASDECAADRELRQQHRDYVRDMLRQIEKLE